MQGLRLLPFLYTLLLVAAACLAQMHPGPGSRPARSQSEQELLDEGVRLVEDKLRLPRGLLQPAFRFNNDQHQAITQHLQDPSSRFAVLHYSNGHQHPSFVISPWKATIPGELESRRGVLAFTIYPGGTVEPAFHARLGGDAGADTTQRLWHFINSLATLTQPELVSATGPPIVRRL
ncbi:uncharacterized protein UTRI_06198_B [Ustilago trichophora]|uniref:Uncharacterized protein n=1 Tax=Ustilago trichophora TaxID=86804 RepID=A0A5C3EH88_9BASI|nr:uncharacterized protein UTRI_06198_B [Ustilago trichophora]